jgi:polar amino acid transport system substrate-binding protein
MARRSALICAAAAAAFAVALAGCGSSSDDATTTGDSGGSTAGSAKLNLPLPDRITKAGVITVANPLSNPPYAFKDTSGKLQGVAPDLAAALGPLLGVRFKFVDTPFPGLIPGLQANKFDMVWGSVTDTKAREALLDFVDYEQDGGILLVAKGNPKKITDIASLCGDSASGLAGAAQLTLLSDQSAKCTAAGNKQITVKTFQDIPSAELALRSGQVDSVIVGLGAGLYQVRTAPSFYQSTGPVYQSAMLGAGFLKADGQLSAAVQAGIKELVANGTYTKIMDKYGLTQAALKADQITLNGATG